MSTDDLQQFLGSFSNANGGPSNAQHVPMSGAMFASGSSSSAPFSGSNDPSRPSMSFEAHPQMPMHAMQGQQQNDNSHNGPVMINNAMLNAFMQQQQHQQQQQQQQQQMQANHLQMGANLAGTQPYFNMSGAQAGQSSQAHLQEGASRPPFAHRRSQSGGDLPTLGRGGGLAQTDSFANLANLDSSLSLGSATSNGGVLNSTSAPDAFGGINAINSGNLAQYFAQQHSQRQQQQQHQQAQSQHASFASQSFLGSGQAQQPQQQQQRPPSSHPHSQSMAFGGHLPMSSGQGYDTGMMGHQGDAPGGSKMMGMNVIHMPGGSGVGMGGLESVQNMMANQGPGSMPPAFNRTMSNMSQGHGPSFNTPTNMAAPQHQVQADSSGNARDVSNPTSPSRAQSHRNVPGATPGRNAKPLNRRRSRGASGSFDRTHNASSPTSGMTPREAAEAAAHRTKSTANLRDAVAAAAADGGVGSGAARSIPGISGASGPAGAGSGSGGVHLNPFASSRGGLGDGDQGTDSGSGSGNANASAAGFSGGIAGASGTGTSTNAAISASATAAAAGAIVSDFTKRKGWSTRIVEELLDFVHVLDFGGRILFASPSVTSITGWRPEDLVGKEIVEFIHPNDRVAFVREFEQLVDAFLNSQPQGQDATAAQMDVDTTGTAAPSALSEKARNRSRSKAKAKAQDSATESSVTTGGLSDPSTSNTTSTNATTVASHAESPAQQSAPQRQPDMLFYYRFAKKPAHRRTDLLRTKSLSRLTFADALASGNIKMGTPGSTAVRPGMNARLSSHATALSRSVSRFGGSDVGSGMGDEGSAVDGIGMSSDASDSMGMMGMGMMGGGGMGMGRAVSHVGAMSTPGAPKHITPGSALSSLRPGGGGLGSDDEAEGSHDPNIDREWVLFEVAGHVYVPPPEAFTAAAVALDSEMREAAEQAAGRSSADLGERRKSSEARRDHADDVGIASGQRAEWPPDAADNVRCVFCSCRVYPSKNVSMFDSFLELKVENERLRVYLGEVEAARGSGHAGGGEGKEWRDEDGRSGASAHLDGGDLGLDASFGADFLASLGDDDIFDDPSGTGSMGGRPQRPRLTSTMLSRGPSIGGLGSGMGSPTSPADAALLDDDDDLGPTYHNAGAAMDSNQDDKRKSKKMRTEEGDHVCTDCGRVDSPEWRKGPLGPKTLCNACGLRWAKKIKRKGGDPNATAAAMAQATANAGRLVPTSPTFSSMKDP